MEPATSWWPAVFRSKNQSTDSSTIASGRSPASCSCRFCKALARNASGAHKWFVSGPECRHDLRRASGRTRVHGSCGRSGRHRRLPSRRQSQVSPARLAPWSIAGIGLVLGTRVYTARLRVALLSRFLDGVGVLNVRMMTAELQGCLLDPEHSAITGARRQMTSNKSGVDVLESRPVIHASDEVREFV